MDNLTEAFLGFLKAKFSQPVSVGDGATDVMRQPLFPGLESKPRQLQAPGLPGMASLPPAPPEPDPLAGGDDYFDVGGY